MKHQLTHHAVERAAQRSFRRTDLQWVIENGDQLLQRPGGADALAVSAAALEEAAATGADSALLGRVRHLTLIIRGDRVLTAYRRTRRYRDGRGRLRTNRRA